MQPSNFITDLILLLIFQTFFVVSIHAKTVFKQRNNCINCEDYGEPAFLTQYIETGDINTAREKSRTGSFPGAPPLTSYSGFLTVNKKYNSNIFFWFVPALNYDKDAPVILWFQGGPGLSGLFGFFVEHGPFVLNANMTANMRDFNWAEKFQVIYVDNPVGTGFSFTDNDKGLITTQEEMAEDMYEFMQQFFKIFYEYKKNRFFVTGNSYGGKYAASLAYKIHTMGNSSGINLQGLAIGNSKLDPETMMDYATFLYNIGMVDEMQAAEMKEWQDGTVDDIKKGKYYNALKGYTKLIAHFKVLPQKSMYTNFTGIHFYYNLLWNGVTADYNYYTTYIQLPEFRKALNVGNMAFHSGNMSQKKLMLDIMKSVKPKIEVLMNNYMMLLYNGQLDVINPYTTMRNFVLNLDWKYSEEFKTAPRKKWTIVVKGVPKYVGYYHETPNFHEVMVRDAGHVLPLDQPMLASDLLYRFIHKIPLS